MITDLNQLDLNKQYTYADYLSWQFEDRVELIRGWISKMSGPQRRHQKISGILNREISNFLKNKPCEVYAAPFDVLLANKRKSAPDNTIYSVVQPDLLVVCDLEKLDEKGCVGAPDWIIEILGPGNSQKEIKLKHSLYEENGVREYWVVSPEYLQIDVFALEGEKFLLRGRYNAGDEIPVGIFEGFSIVADELFK